MSPLRSKHSERGNSLVETALMSPWIFLMFIAILNVGFYAYATICTQNAARVAALAVASSDVAGTTEACTAVRLEMANLPNANEFGTCTSDTLQVTVAADTVAGEPTRRVTVRYRTIPLMPIPGLTGRLTFSRSAEVRLYGE